MSASRPTLLERLQLQAAKLERENAFLRRVDEAMKERLARAVAEADEHKKTAEAQATVLTDLRKQLGQKSLDLELAHAELAAEKASRPSTPTPKTEEQVAPSRFSLLETD